MFGSAILIIVDIVLIVVGSTFLSGRNLQLHPMYYDHIVYVVNILGVDAVSWLLILVSASRNSISAVQVVAIVPWIFSAIGFFVFMVIDASKKEPLDKPFLPSVVLALFLALNLVFGIYCTPWISLTSMSNKAMNWQDILRGKNMTTVSATTESKTHKKGIGGMTITSGIMTEKFETIPSNPPTKL